MIADLAHDQEVLDPDPAKKGKAFSLAEVATAFAGNYLVVSRRLFARSSGHPLSCTARMARNGRPSAGHRPSVCAVRTKAPIVRRLRERPRAASRPGPRGEPSRTLG